MGEPRIHSHIEDGLPDWQALAWHSVDCADCGVNVHSAPPNECMQTWVETGAGNFCWACFAKRGGEVLDERYALVEVPADKELEAAQTMCAKLIEDNGRLRREIEALRIAIEKT